MNLFDVTGYLLVASKCSNQELNEIYHKLNRWEWDDRLGRKPDGWEAMKNYNSIFKEPSKDITKHDYIEPIMDYIETRVSQKELYKYYHMTYCKMTRWQHEIWWLKNLKFRIYLYQKRKRKGEQL